MTTEEDGDGDSSGAMASIEKILLLDAVDPVCGEILQNAGISVTTRGKLTKEQLIKELAVRVHYCWGGGCWGGVVCRGVLGLCWGIVGKIRC